MNPGRFDTRIALHRPIWKEDRNGNAYIDGWEPYQTVAAERCTIRWADSYIAQETYDGGAAEYWVRWEHRVKPGWMAIDTDGSTFEVVDVEENRKKGLRKLKCKKRDHAHL